MKRWVVREGEGPTVGKVVDLAGGDPRAIAEGRVFLGRNRVTVATELVRAGDEVIIAREQPHKAALILAMEDDVVVADKPAGIPTIPDHGGGAHALLAEVARALGVHPGELHPTSRLDRDVSGVVVFARTKDAAARLVRARAGGEYIRRYVAIAERAPAEARGTWAAPIGRARDPRHRIVGGKKALPAITRFASIAPAGEQVLLALAPVTGRTHQLRVHASHAGAPLVGDRTYGGRARITLASGEVLALSRIALHAARVSVPREAGAPLVLSSPVPAELQALWRALGGKDEDWERALAVEI